MDNVFCDGTEEEISNCKFNGWGKHDCTDSEAAGVICLELNQNETNIIGEEKIYVNKR